MLIKKWVILDFSEWPIDFIFFNAQKHHLIRKEFSRFRIWNTYYMYLDFHKFQWETPTQDHFW